MMIYQATTGYRFGTALGLERSGYVAPKGAHILCPWPEATGVRARLIVDDQEALAIRDLGVTGIFVNAKRLKSSDPHPIKPFEDNVRIWHRYQGAKLQFCPLADEGSHTVRLVGFVSPAFTDLAWDLEIACRLTYFSNNLSGFDEATERLKGATPENWREKLHVHTVQEPLLKALIDYWFTQQQA
jgi:hypothetical protein